MFGKTLLFYTVGSTAITLVAQALGAGMGVVLLAALLGPPAVHLALLLMRYKGWL